jgi:signal transduction histidine kinase
MEREIARFRSESLENTLDILELSVRAGRPVAVDMIERLREGPAVGLYDAMGHALARTDHAPALLPAPLLARARARGDAVTVDEGQRLAVRGVSDPHPHFVAVEVGFIERRLGRTRLVVLVSITSASALLALFATFWLTRRIRGQLLQASDVVQRMAQGELEVRLPVSSDDEVGRLAADFNRMAERLQNHIAALQREDARRRRIFADWTHEIATPLSSVLGYLEALRSPALPAERRERYLQRAHEQARALESLSDDLSVLSQLESEGLRLDRAEHDLVGLLRAEADACALRAPRLRLSLDAPERAPSLVDAQRLSQVLRNLLSNAERHARSRIVLRCEVSNPGHLITVEDDGPGIDPEHLQHVTESFYRADASRDRGTGGRGLGLSIAKHIVQTHGGSLSVASEPGRGTAVTLRLP